MLDRWDVLQLVKDTARQTGLGEREIAVLRAHLSVLTKGLVRSDQLLLSYAQLDTMLDRANCMDERRFRRGEARLEELGFITRRLSGNGRRYPVRNGEGQIIDAYGIDLRPLFLRVEELRGLLDQARESACRQDALRSRVSAALSALRRRLQDRLGALPTDFADLHNRIRNLLRRRATTLAEMQAAERELTDFAPAEDVILSDSEAVDAGQIVRHSEPEKKEINKPTHKPTHRPPYKPAYKPDALPADMPLVWSSLSEIPQLYPDPPSSPRDALKVIFDFSGFLGLREATLRDLVPRAGLARMLQVLDGMAQRIDQIRQPDAYLRASALRGNGDMTAVIRGQSPGL